MSTLLSELHFWTTQEDVIIKLSDYGAFKYYNRKEIYDSLNSQSKRSYCERRGLIWNPTNKRQNKFKDKLKEFEDYLLQNKVVYYLWTENTMQLLLSTGLLVNLKINESTGDICNIVFDKQLSTKLQVNIICDGIIIGNQVICVCNDGHVLGHGGPWKEGWLLEGGPRRRLSCYGEWLAVWGKTSSEHPQPWSPLAKDHQRANLHLYWVGARGPELLAYKNSDGEPLSLIVSRTCEHTLILVEQKVTQRGAVSVEVSSLELIGNSLKTASITSVPLQTQVSCCALSHNEDHLLIGCIDGTLALLDRNRGSTNVVKASFIPTLCTWQSLDALVAVCNERGQLQYYDTALNCVKSQIVGEENMAVSLIDLAGYFNSQFSVVSISWESKDLLVALEQGPFILISHIRKSLTFTSLAEKYISAKRIEKAISLLLSWTFSEDSFFILQKIISQLLKHPLKQETAQYLQNALGCYHGPSIPLSSETRHQFGSQVFSMTRRFFHQLVRSGMYETAFLLAVDVGHHDLFMDLHYIAVKIGETEMAAAARAQASALLSRCTSESSNCSRSSCSQCSSTSEDKEELQPQPATNRNTSESGCDNFLTTNFNLENPKTYNNVQNPFIAISIPEVPKITPPPKATFVKSPQVPVNFGKVTNVHAPPLPFNSSLPSLLNSNLGIPLVGTPDCHTGFCHSSMAYQRFNLNNCNSVTALNSNSSHKTTLSTANKNIPISNVKNSFGTPRTVYPPPLPVAPSLSSNNSSVSQTFPPVPPYINAKKPQPKVKFSDTVTAFIVPEIKRPVRPVPPSHVTDPQKELADSLPLCHPNEDYLKDFAPVRRSDSNDVTSEQPKIKVVHFGVV